jgi:hypothetical protein
MTKLIDGIVADVRAHEQDRAVEALPQDDLWVLV